MEKELNKEKVLPIYKELNGKLVRKESNIRDPKRRYASVSTPKENYLREYTDEEEIQRDLEEAKWKEEKPLRLEEEEKIRRKEKEFKESLTYEVRYVGFFDILGWSNAVKDSVGNMEMQQKLGLASSNMRAHMESNEWKKQHGLGFCDAQIIHFSDSLIVSTSPNNDGQSAIISILHFLSDILLNNGFLLRGGITKGEIYHKNSLVYGPALNKAYELEHETAIYPRVILDDELSTTWWQGKAYNVDGKIEQDKTWRLDADCFRFFDFLQPMGGSWFFSQDTKLLHFKLTKIYPFIKECLVKYQEDQNTLKKYIWLANYFNEVLCEADINDIKPIVVQ